MENCDICKNEDHESSMSWITYNGDDAFVCRCCSDNDEEG